MTASIFVKHKVNDFAAWKKEYDNAGPLQKEGGVIAESVHRDPDDPNTVMVYHQFTNLNAAQGFLNAMNSDEEFQAVLKKAGVQPDTVEVWVGEDV